MNYANLNTFFNLWRSLFNKYKHSLANDIERVNLFMNFACISSLAWQRQVTKLCTRYCILSNYYLSWLLIDHFSITIAYVYYEKIYDLDVYI